MKRLRTEDYLLTLEFESAFKDLKTLGFNAALENLKKSSQLLFNEASLKIAEKEAKSLAESCFDITKNILVQQDNRIKYFESDCMEKNKSLCQIIGEGEEEIREFEGFEEKVIEVYEDLLKEVDQSREIDNEKTKLEMEMRGLADNIKDMQDQINDFEAIVKPAADEYRKECRDLKEKQKKSNQLRKNQMLADKISACFKNSYYQFDFKQKIEKFDELKEQKTKETLKLTQDLEESEKLLQEISISKVEVLNDLGKLDQIKLNLKDKYAELEKELNKKGENNKTLRRNLWKSLYKETVFIRKLETTLMQIEEIKQQKKILSNKLKIFEQSLEFNQTFQVLHI